MLERCSISLLSAMLTMSGCALKRDVDNAKRQAAEYRIALEDMQEKRNSEQTDCEVLKTQYARLEKENATIKRQITDAQGRENVLNQRLAIAETRKGRDRGNLEEQQKELQRALQAVRGSREEWERTLAERQRQIEILTNQIERLTHQLRERSQTAPGSQPP